MFDNLIVILVLLALSFPIIAIIALVISIDLRGAVRRLEQRMRMLEIDAPPAAAAATRVATAAPPAPPPLTPPPAAAGSGRDRRTACSATISSSATAAATSHVSPDRSGAAFCTAGTADRF